MGHVTAKVWAAKFEGVAFVVGRSIDFSDGYYRIGPRSRLSEMLEAEGPQDVHPIINLELIFRRAFPEKD